MRDPVAKASRRAATAWLLLTTAALAACGGRGLPDLEPPRISIVELELESAEASLRIDNIVSAPMAATGANLRVDIGGALLGRFEPRLGITVPPLGSELVTVTFDPDSVGARALERSSRGGFTYRISGHVGLESGERLAVDSVGRLSPSPGKPGSFR